MSLQLNTGLFLPVTTGLNSNLLNLQQLSDCSGHTVALDVETTGLQWWHDHIIGVGVHCPQVGISGYFPTLSESDRRAAKEVVQHWALTTVIIAHNLKFDFHFMDLSPVGRSVIDTTVLAHLLDSRQPKNLGAVSQRYLGESKKHNYVIRGRALPVWEWPLELVAVYCENDCRQTYELARKLVPLVQEIECWPLFEQQMQYLRWIWHAERLGIQLDMELLQKSQVALSEHVVEMEQALYDGCGQKFNWNSPQQLSRALYDDLGIAKPENPFIREGKDIGSSAIKSKYTKTATSTFLLMEKANHPLGQLVSELREAAKLRQTLEQWQKLADSEGVIHSNFNLTGTRTGRLSSSKPNIQNLPGEIRSRETQSIYSGAGGATRGLEYNLRNCYISRPGKVLVSIDYRQQEIRMFGLLSGDVNMLKALHSGLDIHDAMARKIWNLTAYDPVKREWAKTTSFGLIYGMTTGSLQYRLNMSRQESLQIADQYWRAFPRVRPWMLEVIEECKQNGYVVYWSKRRWHETDPKYFYRAVNALVQGGSHDLLMTAVNRLAPWLQKTYGAGARIINLVHDEVVLECDAAILPELIPQSQRILEISDLFGQPFFTDAKMGHRFGSLEKTVA